MDMTTVFVIVTVCVVGHLQRVGLPLHGPTVGSNCGDSHLLDEGVLPQITVLFAPGWATPHWTVLREWAGSQDLS